MPAQALTYLEQNASAAVERLEAFLTIPSVSTDPAYVDGIRKAASWVADALGELGLDVHVCHLDSHPPVVVAHTPDGRVANPEAPRVLFYGHYDVQPPDPIDQWTSPPFEPTVRDGDLYARGACDDKGQICCFFEALRAWRSTAGKLPGPLTVVIEGEEECGSVHLPPFIEAHSRDLASNVVLVSDTSMWEDPPGHFTPAITYALRGLLYYDIKLHGPSRDLHSGVYGGTIANPATELTQVLGALFDDDHRVTIPGYYDDVLPLNPTELEQWSKLDFDDKQFLGAVGVTRPFGEAGYTTLERRWARPACDVNGLYGGYMGEGAKTVIPTTAGAKVSFRLAANQDPARIAATFETWLTGHDVHGCRWELTRHGEADPVAVPIDSPFIAAASRAIKATAGRAPVLIREGATIPIVASFKKLLGLDSLLVGFGLESDKIHSPDEHFGLDRFALGCRTHAALLAELAAVQLD